MPQARGAAPAGRDLDRTNRVLLAIGDWALTNTIDLTLRHGNYLRRVTGTINEAEAAIADRAAHLLMVDIDLEGGRAIMLIDEVRVAARSVSSRSPAAATCGESSMRSTGAPTTTSASPLYPTT